MCDHVLTVNDLYEENIVTVLGMKYCVCTKLVGLVLGPEIPTRYSKFILSILGHHLLNVSFSSGTFPGVHVGGQLLPLC